MQITHSQASARTTRKQKHVRDCAHAALLESRSMATAEGSVPQRIEFETKIDPHQRNLAELEARHAIAEEGGGAERRER